MNIDPFGIAGNLIAAAIIFIVGLLWHSHFAPFLSGLMHAGTRLDGKWRGEQDLAHAIYRFELDLKQFGSTLRGTFTSNDTYKGSGSIDNGVQTYVLKGIIRDGFVFLQYEDSQKRLQSMGGFLFSIESHGRELEGHMLFLRSRNAERIGTTTTTIQLKRLANGNT